MKIRILMATATAASVLMTAAALADGNTGVLAQFAGNSNIGLIDQTGSANVAKATQEGSTNQLTIEQNGSANWAGTHMKYIGYDFSGDTGTDYNYILQKGSNNVVDIDQKFRGNIVAVDGNLNQIGDRNQAFITQIGGPSSGGRVNSVTQTSSVGAASTTNTLTIKQEGATPGDYASGPFPLPVGSSDYNYAVALVATVQQTHTSGLVNDIYIEQSGGVYNAGNAVMLARQNGSDNNAKVIQDGRLNLLTTLNQIDDGNTAYLSQTGYNNLTTLIYQDSSGPDGNDATVILNGIDNGRDALVGAAGLAGAAAASVQQFGEGNAVYYSASGDDNAYGFYQNGDDNKAESISITGSRNHLGVYQTGSDNRLLLAAINGNDNVLGVQQDGTSNTASIKINAGGDRNGGYAGFSGSPASTAGLTAGLIKQDGSLNEVSFEVTGDDNLFASLQDGPTAAGGSSNDIKVIINGTSNQAAVKQMGNNNNASLTQVGTGNNAFISQ